MTQSMGCGSYGGIKLVEPAMMMVERIFEYRIQQQFEIGDMHCGFKVKEFCWLTFGEVMGKSLGSCFFDSQCSMIVRRIMLACETRAIVL